MSARAVHTQYVLMGHTATQWLGILFQLEGVFQHRQGIVLGTVINDDDLELGILKLHQRKYRCSDRCLFIERRHQNGNRRFHPKVRNGFPQLGPLAHIAAKADHRQDIERQIATVQQNEIANKAHLPPTRPNPPLSLFAKHPLALLRNGTAQGISAIAILKAVK